MATADLMSRARAGDGDAFRELTEPYRRELQVHCYRMLGSLQDAEDVLQETLLAAWLGFAGFEGRASLRTWLYRIATNRCLNARRAAGRRPAKEWDIPGVEPPEPSRLGEVVWLEPYPDVLLGGAGAPLGPEARYEQTESISLAFVTALQVLPPRQVAVLVLRDVLGFHANEVAGMLDSTVESVNSALKRARASLQRRPSQTADREPPPAAGSPTEDAIVAKFVRAWESADLGALVDLLTDDVFVSMPPMPFEYEGRDLVARFTALLFGAGRRFDLVPARANGQPAFGAYLRTADGMGHGVGLYVLTLAGDRICAMTRFDNSVLASFGLPRSLRSGPVVRRIGADDWRLWREVRLAALADTPAAFASTLEQAQALDEAAWRAMARDAALFVATAGQAGVGMAAGLRRAAAHERGLGAMWVTPSRRGSGVAGMLVRAVIAWARSDGATVLGLWAPADSLRARRFYASQGFTDTGHSRPFPGAPGRHIVEMRLDLASPGAPEGNAEFMDG